MLTQSFIDPQIPILLLVSAGVKFKVLRFKVKF